jgi:hypothetical protein
MRSEVTSASFLAASITNGGPVRIAVTQNVAKIYRDAITLHFSLPTAAQDEGMDGAVVVPNAFRAVADATAEPPPVVVM